MINLDTERRQKSERGRREVVKKQNKRLQKAEIKQKERRMQEMQLGKNFKKIRGKGKKG